MPEPPSSGLPSVSASGPDSKSASSKLDECMKITVVRSSEGGDVSPTPIRNAYANGNPNRLKCPFRRRFVREELFMSGAPRPTLRAAHNPANTTTARRIAA